MATRHGAQGDAMHEAHGTDNPAVEAGMSRDSLNIPANVILDGIRDYAPQDQDDLLWLAGYIREGLQGSRRAACEALATSWQAERDKFPESREDDITTIGALAVELAAALELNATGGAS